MDVSIADGTNAIERLASKYRQITYLRLVEDGYHNRGDLSLVGGLIGTSWRVEWNQWQIEKNYKSKIRRKNLSISWVDCKKVYNTSPLSWILECVDILCISDQIKSLLEETIWSQRVKLICGDKLLGKVNMEGDIFQGDWLLPLTVVMRTIILTSLLRNVRVD